MKITDIKVRRTFRTGNILAVVSITIDNCFAVHDIKIIDNGIRRFAAMPSRFSSLNGAKMNVEHFVYKLLNDLIQPGLRV